MADEQRKPPRKPRSKSRPGAEPPEPPDTGDGLRAPGEGEAVEGHAEFVARHFGGGVEATPETPRPGDRGVAAAAGRGRPRPRPDPAEPAGGRGRRRRRTWTRPHDRHRNRLAAGRTQPDRRGREDNGTVTCVVVHPSNPDIIYRGTNSGGLWKTIDGGTTWRALFDHEDGRGVGEAGGVALDPNDLDVVYVGISDHVFQRSFSVPFINTIVRRGLYRSLDGGASWVLLGSGFPAGNTGNATNFANVSITEVIVDPANSNRLYVAADDGVHVSTDRGLNWTRGAGLAAAVDSLELDTHDSVERARPLCGRQWQRASSDRPTAARTGRPC